MTVMLAMEKDAILAFLEANFPQALDIAAEIGRVDERGLELELETDHRHLRPGGTVAGPVLMTLADSATYLAILSRRGLAAAQAVTTSIEVHFLRRPAPGLVRATCRLLKLGRRLAVATVEIRRSPGEGDGDGKGGDAEADLVAYATVTYALPG